MSVFVAKELCDDRMTSSVDHQAIGKKSTGRALSLGNTPYLALLRGSFLGSSLSAHHNGAMSLDLLYSVIPLLNFLLPYFPSFL